MVGVLVAVQLREQEVHPGIDDGLVGRKAKPLKGRPMPPKRQKSHHHKQRGNLPGLDANIKAQDAQQHFHVVFSQRQLLQAS